MVVVSLFQHSLKIELAISELEQHKVSNESILAKVILLIKVEDEKVELVEDILRKHQTLGMVRI
jgi:hypothetical protein